MNSGYDAWLTDKQLWSLDNDDRAWVAWFQVEMGLSREDLRSIFARARDIMQEFKATDELLDMSYDADVGNWYIHFSYPVPNGRLTVREQRLGFVSEVYALHADREEMVDRLERAFYIRSDMLGGLPRGSSDDGNSQRSA